MHIYLKNNVLYVTDVMSNGKDYVKFDDRPDVSTYLLKSYIHYGRTEKQFSIYVIQWAFALNKNYIISLCFFFLYKKKLLKGVSF